MNDYNKTEVFKKNNNILPSSGHGMKITIFNGQEKSVQIDLKKYDKNIIYFGREKIVQNRENDIVISNKLLSRAHGYFSIVDGDVYIVNTNDSNGTIVNGKFIDKCKLKDGDIIKIDNIDDPLDEGVSIIFSTVDNEEEWKTISIEGKNKISII